MQYCYNPCNIPVPVGHTYVRSGLGHWVRVLQKQMPPISSFLKHSVFYLYENEEYANSKSPAGGTGFFVHGRTAAGLECVYAITNRHVVEKGNSVVIRLNTFDDHWDTINPTLSGWFNHPDNKTDIAIASVHSDLDFNKHRILPIPHELFVTPAMLGTSVDIGDDVYMLGRFVHHGGATINKPVARAGMIGLLPDPDDLIPMSGMHPQEAFLVDMRSLSGFSGSPAFFHNDLSAFASYMETVMESAYGLKQKPDAPLVDDPIALLGIDTGSFPIYNEVQEKKDGKWDGRKTMRSIDSSGFAVVIPAWKILEAMNHPFLQEERAKMDSEKDMLDEDDMGAVADVSQPSDDKDERPLTRETFQNALQQASRRTSELDQETKET